MQLEFRNQIKMFKIEKDIFTIYLILINYELIVKRRTTSSESSLNILEIFILCLF